jgi:hypothetical protein
MGIEGERERERKREIKERRIKGIIKSSVKGGCCSLTSTDAAV